VSSRSPQLTDEHNRRRLGGKLGGGVLRLDFEASY
jgi:hypothetical protein